MGNAENAYLFRHAMMRLAAYELQPPTERSELHAHAYAIIETLSPDEPDQFAGELADHARDAAGACPDASRRRAMQEREARWLKPAMERARARSNLRPALEYAERLLNSPAASIEDRHAGGIMAAELSASVGEFARAPELLAQVEQFIDEHEHPGLYALILVARTNSYLLPQRGYDEAEAALHKALKLLRAAGDRFNEARAVGYLGNLNAFQDNREQAMRHYENALAIFRELDNKRGISTSVGNLGLIYKYFGRYDEAEQAYREAYLIDEEVGFREGLPRHIGNLGVLYRDQDRLEEALELFEQAGDSFRQLGERSGMMRNAINWADCLARAGQLHRAALLFQQAERLAVECGLPHYQADCLYYRGEVLLKQGDAVRGEPVLAEAALIFEQINSLYAAAESWDLLARDAFKREDFEAAARQAKSCLANLEAAGHSDEAMEFRANAMLAESALATGDLRIATRTAERALELAPEHEKDPIRIATLKAVAKRGRASSAM